MPCHWIPFGLGIPEGPLDLVVGLGARPRKRHFREFAKIEVYYLLVRIFSNRGHFWEFKNVEPYMHLWYNLVWLVCEFVQVDRLKLKIPIGSLEHSQPVIRARSSFWCHRWCSWQWTWRTRIRVRWWWWWLWRWRWRRWWWWWWWWWSWWWWWWWWWWFFAIFIEIHFEHLQHVLPRCVRDDGWYQVLEAQIASGKLRWCSGFKRWGVVRLVEISRSPPEVEHTLHKINMALQNGGCGSFDDFPDFNF